MQPVPATPELTTARAETARPDRLASLRQLASSVFSSVSRPYPLAVKISGIAGIGALGLGVAAAALSSSDRDTDAERVNPYLILVSAPASDSGPAESPAAEPAQEQTLFPAYTRIVEAKSAPSPASLPAKGVRIPKGWDPEVLFSTPQLLSASLAKLESLPFEAAFRAAVLVESSGRQFDQEGNVMRSVKNAIGIAQILPSTAASIANRCTGSDLDYKRLEQDEQYNLALGKCYYKIRYDEHNQSPILAALAYNMGTKHVHDQIKRVGDPTKGEISMLDFVRQVRFEETRHYTLYMVKKSGILDGVEPDYSYQDNGGTRPAFYRAARAKPYVLQSPKKPYTLSSPGLIETSVSGQVSAKAQAAGKSPMIQ